MKVWHKVASIATMMAVPVLFSFPAMSVNSKEYNPFYYPELKTNADCSQVDFSAEYREWLVPDSNERFEDITLELLNKGYDFDRFLFNSSLFVFEDENGNANCFKESSFDGVLGAGYARIEIFIRPEVERIDSLTFRVKGKSKVGKNICDFAGEIQIEHIFHIWERTNDPDSPDYCVMVGRYLLKEDEMQGGSGFFRGVCGVYCYVDDETKAVCLDIDLGVADGWNQRNYVGVWQSYKTNVEKKCIWGEYRLPYTFDFDIGDGEMRINPKYVSPEWEQWQYEMFNPEKEICWWKESRKGG